MGQVVRWGILGAAGIAGGQFVPAVRAAGRSELWTVAARDPARARAFAAEHGAHRHHERYEDVLADPEVDAVYVALPNALHAEWTVAAARAGKPVVCEKPFAISAQEAVAVLGACRLAGVPCWENFVYRHHPQTARVQAWLNAGAIGQLRTVHASFHFTLRQPRRAIDIRMSAALAGGALMDVGCYPVSWLRTCFGEEPVSASAVARVDPEHAVDTQMVGLLQFPGHRAGTFSCSFDAPGSPLTRLTGTEGEIEVSQPFHPRGSSATLTLRPSRGAPEVLSLALDEPPFTAFVRHVQECLLDGQSPRLTAEDAVGNMAAIDALQASAAAQGATRPVLRFSPEG